MDDNTPGACSMRGNQLACVPRAVTSQAVQLQTRSETTYSMYTVGLITTWVTIYFRILFNKNEGTLPGLYVHVCRSCLVWPGGIFVVYGHSGHFLSVDGSWKVLQALSLVPTINFVILPTQV